MSSIKITIESQFASRYPDEPGSWSGEVDICPNQESEVILEQVFRTFNRATQEDCDLLDKIAYNLPSLSTNDTVTLHFPIIGDETWVCRSIGWEKC